MVYPIVTPRIVRKLFPGFTWEVPGAAREVYLSFDDGPEPTVTPWVLDRLEDAGVKATFFCIGKNVEAHPGIFRRILTMWRVHATVFLRGCSGHRMDGSAWHRPVRCGDRRWICGS